MHKTAKNFRGSPYYGFRLNTDNDKSSRLSEASVNEPRRIEISLSPKNSSLIADRKRSRTDKTKKELYLFRDVMIQDQAYLPFLCSLREQPPTIKTSKNAHQFSVASKNTFCNTSKSRGKQFTSSRRINPFQHVWRLKSNQSIRDNVNFQSQLRNYSDNPQNPSKHTIPFQYINFRLDRTQDIQPPSYDHSQACSKYINTMQITKRKRWKKSVTTIS